MHDRIKKLRKELGLTQQEFADRLGIKGNTVSQYEIGRNAIPEAVIRLICTTFGVDEQWLKTGEGEMFRPVSRSDELYAFFGDVMSDEPDSFRFRFCSALAELDADEWQVAEKFFRSLLGQ